MVDVRRSVKNASLKIYKNSQENTCAGVSFFGGVFLQVLHKFLKHLFHWTPANGSFQKHVHKSMQIMHGLHNTLKKDGFAGKRRCTLVERNWVYFHLIFVWWERNQTRYELSSQCNIKFFNLTQAVSFLQPIHEIYRKT